MKKPNVVFITTDHQRADTIGMIQSGIEVTPNLNQLVKESVLFERAYTACPLCAPARTSLATGLFPSNTGIVNNDFQYKKTDKTKKIRTLHEFLRGEEYSLAHFGPQHVILDPRLEERVKFEKFITEIDYREEIRKENISLFRDTVAVEELVDEKIEYNEYTSPKSKFYDQNMKFFRDRYYVDNCLEYMDSLNGEEKSFAIFLNIWAPHPPFNVPREFYEKFKEVKLPKNINIPVEGEPGNRRKGMAAQLAGDHSLEEWEESWKAYLGLTNLADSLVGEILNKLKEKHLYKNTIIIFTADHGDNMGQHKMFQKMEMYEQCINVPFMLKAPDLKPSIIDNPVSHLDILPTLLEILDIDSNQKFDGQSLKNDILEGKSLNGERYVYSQYSGNKGIGSIRRAVIGKRYKYVYDGTSEAELFDLYKDPLEEKNIVQDKENQEIKNKYEELLGQWLKDKDDWVRIL